MATLSIANPYQIYATSGRTPNINLSDALRAQLPGLYTDLDAKQRQREFELQSRGLEIDQGNLDLARRGLELSAQNIATQQQALENQRAAAQLAGRQQAAAQKQATIGAAISGVTGAAQLALAGKSLFGAAPAAPAAATVAPAATTGTAATVAGAAPTAAEGVSGGVLGEAATGAATTATTATAAPSSGFAALGSAGGAASGLGIAGIGALGGGITGKEVEKLAGGGVGGKVAGHATGAATGAGLGALAGTFVFPGIGTAAGAVLGAIGGGLSATFCILHEAAYGRDSREVEIARRFRDQFLSTQALRAYYATYEPVAARMHQDPAYRMHIRTSLTDKLVRYGAEALHMEYTRPSEEDRAVARAFLMQLERVGHGMPPFRRANGEVV